MHALKSKSVISKYIINDQLNLPEMKSLVAKGQASVRKSDY